MSSVITIGFSGRTRACIRSEFTPPIADDEHRETLIHVALLTARTFAALPADMQITFAATLKEWIEDHFIACPTHLIPGDPMACLPRFASTFVAPVREYALASKGCNNNGRGIQFFLPMALVSFLRHVTVTYPDHDELLKPALALCAAVVIQPLTMETHFRAAAASLPKVASVVEKTAEEESPVSEEISKTEILEHEETMVPMPVAGAAPVPRRRRRRTLLLSACLAALLIIAGVQYLSVHDADFLSMSGREPSVFQPPPQKPQIIVPPKAAEPTKVTELPQQGDMPPAIPPAVNVPATAASSSPPPAIQTPQPSDPTVTVPVAPAVITQRPAAERPGRSASMMEEAAAKKSSKNIRVYQQDIREVAEDAMAQVEVLVGAIEGQILTEFDLGDVLAQGYREVRNDMKRLERMPSPETYETRHQEVREVVSELERLARELTQARMQPAANVLQDRLSDLRDRLEHVLQAIDNL